MIYLLAEFSIMGGLIKAKYRWKNFSQQDFLNIPPLNLPTQKNSGVRLESFWRVKASLG